ncbi:hypothetical protein CEUSTIGMA_g2024.t1 [Chlamydomonas eustigma]|uniref:tRNA-dihydrouridine(47) synthase [NAD(P)(+)] n=1 Tax=Chlamydomonas eustigma TaxID=1157962 RepID=A0A250WUU8_9CHLO|nr:hypothetical protein CEUSTIGMA_g2024.t1 [Chlamydomonas eustigma]|eukprot:GAX74575.1 hypothetical protein CEUSTIGMA_g2024.t1 [Chlamydomonas eustigma]
MDGRCVVLNRASAQNRLTSTSRKRLRLGVTSLICDAQNQQSKKSPSVDYVSRMRAAQDHTNCCPFLMLAPMESLGDWRFRHALRHTAGGFDEACTEFLRIPNRTDHPWAAVKGVVSGYNAYELGNVPIGAQIMSSNPQLLGLATQLLFQRQQAPRVDLNCGCPANTVTGNGAGSSLLRTPEVLYECVNAMVKGAQGLGPVSVKMRAGYQDTSLFEENLLAAQEGGAAFVTIHPRTKVQTYDGRADWTLTARAKQLLEIPVVGNGDIVSAEAAKQMLAETGCGALMVGRGAVSDPLLFLRIRAAFPAAGIDEHQQLEALPWDWDEPEIIQAFLRRYASTCLKTVNKNSISKSPGGAEKSEASAVCNDQGSASPGMGGGDDWAVESSSADRYTEQQCQSSMTPSLQSIDHRLAMSRSAFFGRMKKIMRYLFSTDFHLWNASETILRAKPDLMTCEELVEVLCSEVQKHWAKNGGPRQQVLYNHMTKTAQILSSSATDLRNDNIGRTVDQKLLAQLVCSYGPGQEPP